MAAVVARARALEHVSALLDSKGHGMRALVLEGEAGIGKTTVWRAAVKHARDVGYLVLASSPAQSEASLPYAALGDALRPITDRIDSLPEAPRDALEVALGRKVAKEPPPDVAVARATHELIAGASGRTLLAIDDVQWLDRPSERAFQFALRRLDNAEVRVLVARRSERLLPPPLELDRTLDHGRLDTYRFEPLTLAELDGLVRSRLNIRLLRPQLARLHDASGGNPFYALEIARAASNNGFTVPETLSGALTRRLEQLSTDARDAALLTSAAARPTARLVELAAESSVGIEQAIAGDVLALDGSRLRFTHPLLASVTYESARPWAARAAHLRLAAHSSGAERAHNLALGTEDPSPEVAAELTEAARASAARGGFDAAATLAEHAARLTPSSDGESRVALQLSAADYHRLAGDYERARAIFEDLAATLDPGPRRADVQRLLAGVLFENRSGIELCLRALAEANGDPLVRSRIHKDLAAYLWIAGETGRAIEHSASGVEAAREAGDRVATAVAIGQHCYIQVLHGDPWDREAMDEGLAVEASTDDFIDCTRPSYQLGVISTYADKPGDARPLLEAELERIDAAGRIGHRWIVLYRLVQCDLRAGAWAAALANARVAAELAAQTGGGTEVALTDATLGLVLGHTGQLDEAAELTTRAHETAATLGGSHLLLTTAGACGFVEIARGAHEEALAHLTPAREELVRRELREFSPYAVVENEIEALLALGRLDEAAAVCDIVLAAGLSAARTWHRAIAARGRALVAAGRGDEREAREQMVEALIAHESLPQPFELGRTFLAQGQIERRFKHRAAARSALGEALELFDELGAAIWAERAATELARIPGRSRASNELTETERRVAELVAEGLSNKEVAARLFITVRTVEANLTKVYAKLGVRSRTELASKLRT